MAEYLEACRKQEIKRLLINLPPRSLKSICVSVAWPAFLLGLDPSARIMAASYAATLSLKHSTDCRNVMLSPWYRQIFPKTQLTRYQNEKRKFTTTAHGHRIATSVGGSATGEGGNFLIVDDPQNPQQAMSNVQRRYAAEWFDHTFASRLDDKRAGVMVVVMQRLHVNDLSGHLMEKGGWEQLLLPAIADAPTAYHFGRVEKWREAGEVLHPGRDTPELLVITRQELGGAAFEAQYQQNPLPAEGGLVRREWLRRFAEQPAQWVRKVQSWDTAIKAGTQHDASVCLTFGEGEARHYLLDVQVMRLEYPALKRMIVQMAADWQPDLILMEDKASGQSLLQDLKREMQMPLVAVMPRGDKIARMAAASAWIESGKLLLPREASWLAEFERELLAFPHAPHDDQVDGLSQYLNWVRGREQRSNPNLRQI